MNVLGICAGIGGIELGLHVATNGAANPVCFIERDRFAQSILKTRWTQTPIWDDVTTFDATEWAGRVDCITAGFPCQPFSSAGKKLRQKDERWLWPAIENFIRDIRPHHIFLENVSGLLVGGLDAVLASLAACGFDAEWSMFSCAMLGASHRRQRVFIYARRMENLLNFRGSTKIEKSSHNRLSGCNLADSNRQRLEQLPASERAGLPFWAPGQRADWAGIPPKYWPVELSLRGVADGISRWLDPDRKNRLKALGNAVSPPVAAYAWRVLTERMDSR